MNEYLPWVILLALLALLAWTVAPHLRRAYMRLRAWLVHPRAPDTARELAHKDTSADEHEAQANAATQKRELERQAAETASLHAAQQEAERAQSEQARQQAELTEQAEQAQQVAAREAAEQARQQEAQQAQAARMLALQDEKARQDQAAAAEQARRDEADRQLTELAIEQARRTAEEVAPLEVQAEDQATPTPPETRAPTRTPAQTLVLVVDDSKVVRVKTSRLLAKHGYRVTLAEDGADAARQMAQTPPHVLITDVEMPGMDGFELSRHLRGLPHMAHIPIIMITSAEEKYAPQAAQVGVNVLLGKPYRDEDLIAQVESSLTGCIETGPNLVFR